jgi:hypothetical protein
VDDVAAPRQPGEHAPRLRRIGGLAEEHTVHHHDRVGTDRDDAGPADRRGLLHGQALGVDLGGLAVAPRLVHVGGDGVEGQTEEGEQLAPPR